MASHRDFTKYVFSPWTLVQIVQLTLAQKGLHTFSICLLLLSKGLLVALAAWTLNRFLFLVLVRLLCETKNVVHIYIEQTIAYLPSFNATFIKAILLAALQPNRST